jgi:hypothetical protein
MSTSARQSWHAWRRYNPASASDPQASYEGGYLRGYRDALADTVEFQGLHQSVDRLANVLTDLLIEREAVRLALDEPSV